MTADTVPRSSTTTSGKAEPPRRTGGWRPALRIARRTVRRNLGRSLLVASLVALPVAGATMVDGIVRTTTSPERDTYQAIGTADALVVVTASESLVDYASGSSAIDLMLGTGAQEAGPIDRDPDDVELAALLPPGSEYVPAAQQFWSARVERGQGTIHADVHSVTFDHPLTEQHVRLVSGRWPTAPGEVLVTEDLADRLGLLAGDELRAGATITLADGPDGEVTGIGLAPSDLRGHAVFTAPESEIAGHLAESGNVPSVRLMRGWSGPADTAYYLVDLPDGVDPAALWPKLARDGVALIPRDVFLHPEEYSQTLAQNVGVLLNSPEALAAAGLVVLVVGLGLLEVVLLAGAAFAVGAKRQVRDLGLVAAGGGTSAHIRRIVLAQGVVMGAIGAAIGLACGVALTVIGTPLWQNLDNALIEEWHWGGVELAVAAGVGLFSGLAAAIVPAVSAARLSPIDALARRFRATPLAARLPKAGVVLAVAGAAGALLASRVAATALDDYAERLEAAAGSGAWVMQPNVTGYFALQLLGAVTAVAGLIMLMPFFLTRLARRAGRLPMSARYAARDAARHRHRTTPAVAAIMIVVAGGSGVAYGLAAQDRVNELRYTPALPPATMSVNAAEAIFDGEIADEVAEALPAGEAVPVRLAASGTWSDEFGETYHDAVWLESGGCSEEELAVGNCSPVGENVAIATPELLRLAYGDNADGQVTEMLDEGRIVVPSHDFAPGGEVTIETWDPETGDQLEPVTLPAHVLDRDVAYYQEVPRIFISTETAAAAGWDTFTQRALVTYDASASLDDLDAAYDAADKHAYRTNTEQGRSDVGMGYIALAAGTGLVTLIGVGVVVSLAGAEGRADLATMAAVGAPPRRRRAIAGSQALFVAGLGSVLGLVLGTYYGYLTYPAIGAPQFVVPWLTIGTIGVGVPLLAALVAVLFTRSRLPMVRRIE